MFIHNILKKALITEKTTKESEKGKYAFLVDLKADKNKIRHAIEKAFGVDVVKVMTVNTKGRTMRSGARRVEKTLTPVKKAIVVLKKGQTLAGPSTKEEVKDKKEKKK